MNGRRFAEDTRVPVGQTQGEIKERLRKASADQIAVFESPDKTSIMFRLGWAMYRVTIPIQAKVRNRAQEERRAWRLMGLLIKSKLEAIRAGATTVEREFLADMLLYDGQTVSEKMGPELQLAHDEGRMPKTLLLEGPKG
jgi:hypothetical protein